MAHSLDQLIPVTQENVDEAFAIIFAPWIKQMGITDFEVRQGYCSCRLPQTADLQFMSGATCGQAMMAAIDTVAALAAATADRPSKGTVYQHTHFLRPAVGEDMLVAAEVRRFGKSSAFIDCNVTLAQSGKLCAHAVLEFAF